MTKPKLDACEGQEQWVSKLAPYAFDLKHIPYSKDIVSDSLSRGLFTVGCRPINESYSCLLTEAEGISEDGIQDNFHLKV